MLILNRAQIEALIDLPNATTAIEQAYIAASAGRVNLPPVGHLAFENIRADCHIKYGHIIGSKTFAIKIATGFPANADHGTETGNGLVLVLSAETGAVQAMLHDEMMLTDIRTGIGGAIASRRLARPDTTKILILGTGPQLRRQIEAHATLLNAPLTFEVWGRNPDRVKHAVATLNDSYQVTSVTDLEAASRQADIIITATGATAPLIQSEWITPGTHITAVGADAPGKQELETSLVARADLLVSDLTSQCLDHGELSHAFSAGLITTEDVTEIGIVLDNPALGRQSPTDITIADLTGIAAQDIAIADAVLTAHNNSS